MQKPAPTPPKQPLARSLVPAPARHVPNKRVTEVTVAAGFRGRKKAMLLAIEETRGNITMAARLAVIHKQSHYRWMGQDSKYRAAAEEAIQDAHQAEADMVIGRAHV